MIELQPSGIAHGGEAIARLDGKAHFVEGAMPGERVSAEVVKDGGSWARAELVEVLEPSPQRVDPPCRHFDECGGCQWQFAEYQAQLEWKQSVVEGQLAHLGRMSDPPVRATVAPGDPYHYRNRMDFAVEAGRPALRRRRSRDLTALDECLLLEPRLAELLEAAGDLGRAEGITLRIGVTTGETLAVIEGPVPKGIESWGCSVAKKKGRFPKPIIGTGEIHETVGGVTFRITGHAFFQSNTAGAAVLVDLVDEALAPGPADVLLDAYAGGGLFGLTVGRNAARLLAIESSPLGINDLIFNARSAGIRGRIEEGTVEQAAAELEDEWTIAVVDPPRTGLGREGAAAVVRTRPRAIAYVSCDPAALARDTRLLAEAGYSLDWAAPVDMFPQTFHIETVASFVAG